MIKSTKLEKDKAKKAKESLANFNFKIQQKKEKYDGIKNRQKQLINDLNQKMDAVEQKASYKMEMAERNRSNMYKNLID